MLVEEGAMIPGAQSEGAAGGWQELGRARKATKMQGFHRPCHPAPPPASPLTCDLPDFWPPSLPVDERIVLLYYP